MKRVHKNDSSSAMQPESEFREALSRLGASTEKNAKWFIAFAGLDFENLTHEQLLKCWHDLLALMILASRPPDLPANKALTTSEASSWRYLKGGQLDWDKHNGCFIKNDDYRAWWQWMASLQLQIRERIESALEDVYPPLELSHVTIYAHHGALLPVFPLDLFFRNDPESVRGADGPVLIRLALVLQLCGNKLRCCPACKNIYLAVRTDQRFCTATCRSRVGMASWRARSRSADTSPSYESSDNIKKRGRSHGKKGR